MRVAGELKQAGFAGAAAARPKSRNILHSEAVGKLIPVPRWRLAIPPRKHKYYGKRIVGVNGSYPTTMISFPQNMNRLENYLVAIAGVILSGLVSVYSKELRGFIHAGVKGFRKARIASLEQKVASAKELHSNLQVLTAMIGLKLTRMFILTFMAIAPLVNDIIYNRPIGGSERTFSSFIMGIIVSEIVIFNRQLWRSLNLPS